MKIFKAIILSAVILFIVFIIYISILGENHKIDDTINNFFENIKKRDFIEATHFFTKQQKEALANDDFSEMSFLLELSLLKKYDLIGKDNYKIKLKRSQFWLPFTGIDRIGVSVLFEDTERSSFNKHSDYIENLIVVKRISGIWRIAELNIDDSALKDTYEKFKLLLNENRFIKMTSERTIELQNKKINLDEIQPYEKRMLKYFLYEIIIDINEKREIGQ